VKLVLPPGLALRTSVTSELEPLAKEALKSQLFVGQESEPEYPVESASPATEIDWTPVAEPMPSADVPVYAVPSVTPVEAQTSPAAAPVELPAPVQEEGPKAGWRVYAMVVWLGGVWLLGGWLILRFRQLRRVHRERKGAARVPKWFGKMVKEAAGKLGLRLLLELISEAIILYLKCELVGQLSTTPVILKSLFQTSNLKNFPTGFCSPKYFLAIFFVITIVWVNLKNILPVILAMIKYCR